MFPWLKEKKPFGIPDRSSNVLTRYRFPCAQDTKPLAPLQEEPQQSLQDQVTEACNRISSKGAMGNLLKASSTRTIDKLTVRLASNMHLA